MPPEPVPWDRKDFVFKERKHERGTGSDALGTGSSFSTPRWRESYHGPRDLPRASPRRPPSGHCRQGGSYHQIYPEESGSHGCTPSRSDRFWSEDESFRPSSGRYGGGRSGSRESRGSFRRFPYWDSVDFSRQQHHDPHLTAQRSVAVPMPPASQAPLKDPNDKTGDGVDDGSGTGHRFHQDHSLGSISWKPLKWSRPGSLSSTKAPRSESEETGLEVSLPPGKESPIRSPVTSPPSDEGALRKKPRLGWGQGLAKYEKQKVEGSLDPSGTSAKVAVNDTSQNVVVLAGCPSPATPGSFTCSSSPAGVEEKPCIKAVNGENDTSYCSDALEEFSTRLGYMEGNPINVLNTLLADLLQPEDSSSGDSTFSREIAINKLLLLKSGISKELEKTACELDLFENKLKSMDSDAENDPCRSSFMVPGNSAPEPCVESSDVASKDFNPSKDHESSSSACTGNTTPYTTSLNEHNTEIKDGDVDNPQAASSGFNDSASSSRGVYGHDNEKLAGCFEILEDRFKIPEVQHFILSDVERPALICDHGDGNCAEAGRSSENGNSEASLHGTTDSNLITLIMSTNWDAAKKASQVFHKALPTDPLRFDIWESGKLLSQRKNDLRIKEKLAIHKYLLKFKERVLALKFRALHHLWKEDLRLLSIRKHRSKSSKHFELSSRASQGGSQKQRCSFRSRFSLPAGNLTLVPTTEIVEFTSKLLSDSQIKLYRNNLKMPALILEEERKQTKFITHNGLIEDPISFEKERAVINPWKQEEKEIFMEMLATFGKDFTKISSLLNHKTTADCIEFYYKNHKSDSFKEVKKRLDLKKQQQCVPTSSYLVTSGKKWNRGINAASLDMLGAASVVAAHSSGNAKIQQRYTGRSIHGTYNGLKVSCGNYRSLERVSSVEIPGHERETVAADVLAGMCGALSSEAMSSCVTSSVDPVEKMNYMAVERPLTPEVAQNLDEDTCSNEGCGDLDSFDWTDEEKSVFIRALSMYGKDFARISRRVGTRSRGQCKIFFSKARKCLGLDVIRQGIGNGVMPMGDANGGRGDTDDACAAEMDSAICSTQSCSKMDADVSQSVAKISIERCVHAPMAPLQAETDRSSEQGVVGGIILEEGNGKVDKHVSVHLENKLASEGDNPQSVTTLNKNADAALRSNESVQLHEAVERADAAMKIGGSIVSAVEPVFTACMEVESKSHIDGVVRQKDNDGKYSTDVLTKEVDVPLLMPETLSHNKQQMDADLTNGGKIFSASDSKADGNSLLPGKEVVDCPRSTFAPDHQHQIPLDLLQCLQKKAQGISSKQEDPHSVPLVSVLPDPSSVCFEDPHHVASQATLNLEEHGNKQHQNPLVRDLCQQYVMRNPSLNQVDQPFHILRGYPLQVINQEVKRETDPVIGEKPVLMEGHPKRNEVSQSNQFFVSEVHGDHCNHSSLSHPRPGVLFPLKSEAQPEGQSRHCSQNACSEPEEQVHRISDVKLFGQIICHPSSSQKSNSSECNSKPSSPRINRSSTWKTSDAVKAGMPIASTPGNSGHVGLEELPARSYGFCDGNRVQTEFSSLPESAVMLAKYHGSLAGMSFYSAKDCVPCSNGILAQQAYMQHLASDGKRLESFCELQKRNGIEMVSGFQQQGRVARLGANTVGGGILGSGGVSDPVAALKMHYAARAKVLGGEMESWRGDIGGR